MADGEKKRFDNFADFAKARQARAGGVAGKDGMPLSGPGGPTDSRFMQQAGMGMMGGGAGQQGGMSTSQGLPQQRGIGGPGMGNMGGMPSMGMGGARPLGMQGPSLGMGVCSKCLCLILGRELFLCTCMRRRMICISYMYVCMYMYILDIYI